MNRPTTRSEFTAWLKDSWKRHEEEQTMNYLSQDFSRCPSNPILEQCKQCSRNVNNSPVSPTAMWQSWIGPWVGHGPCPNGDFVEKKVDEMS